MLWLLCSIMLTIHELNASVDAGKNARVGDARLRKAMKVYRLVYGMTDRMHTHLTRANEVQFIVAVTH